jgi:3-oxoacyl-[acyl-carrier protein] reductase
MRVMGMIDGKVAIVTGSGRGIGAASAKKLGAEGALVVVSDIDPAPAEETVAAIRSAGGSAIAVVGDVTAPAFPSHLIKATLDSFGGLDIIVNSAGYAWDSVIQSMTDKQWYAMLDVHTTAPFRILREAFVSFIRDAAKHEHAANGVANPRKVVNITSVSALYGIPGQINYSAGKAAIIGMTKTLSREWGRYNINVNCACFGFIETRMTASKKDAEKLERFGEEIHLGIPEHLRHQAKSLIPLGRTGTPEDAAGAVLFLASPLADFVSGAVLEVTGGGTI